MPGGSFYIYEKLSWVAYWVNYIEEFTFLLRFFFCWKACWNENEILMDDGWMDKPSIQSFQTYGNFLLVLAGCSARTASAPPVRRGLEPSKWRCACGTRFTIWSASSVPPVRSTSAWATATCSSTQTLCASRTSLSGPNSTAATWLSQCLNCLVGGI